MPPPAPRGQEYLHPKDLHNHYNNAWLEPHRTQTLGRIVDTALCRSEGRGQRAFTLTPWAANSAHRKAPRIETRRLQRSLACSLRAFALLDVCPRFLCAGKSFRVSSPSPRKIGDGGPALYRWKNVHGETCSAGLAPVSVTEAQGFVIGSKGPVGLRDNVGTCRWNDTPAVREM